MLLCLVVPAVPQCWEEMLDALDAVTPLVDDARIGVAFLDMRGIAGDTTTWMHSVRNVLARFNVPVRLGEGPNKICAYAATWLGDGARIARGREREMLASVPLDVLDLDDGTRDRLHLLGITTLGALADLPHGPFVRRFGREAARWHEWARGIDHTPLRPRAHAIPIEASLLGEGPIDAQAQLFFALRILLARVCGDLERCGKRAAAVQLDVELDDGSTQTMQVLLASPTASERAMLDVLRAKLEGTAWRAPLVGLRVRAANLEEGGEELALFAGDDIDAQNVAVTLARIEAVLGEPVVRAHTQPAHTLEERFVYTPFAFTVRAQTPEKCAALPPEIVPQLRLLAVHEIEVVVAYGEPAFVGSPKRAVLECAGPWRVEEGWFAAPVVRDEYDVLLDDGELVRIYRQGKHWYARGLYD